MSEGPSNNGYTKAKIENLEGWMKSMSDEIKAMRGEIREVVDTLTAIKVTEAVTRNELKNKAGLWGLLAGAIPTTITILIGIIVGWAKGWFK